MGFSVTVVDATVIVPVRDRTHLLQDLVSSIDASARIARSKGLLREFEVLVIDDRSAALPSPASREVSIQVARNSGSGPGAARNTGAELARHDVLLFTDSDCIVAPTWLTVALGHASDGSQLVQGDPCRYQRNTPWGKHEERLYRTMFSTYVNAAQDSSTMLDSRNLLVRRDVLLNLGGFDTSFEQATAEARVLAKRASEARETIRYAPRMAVYHRAPESLFHEIRTKHRHGHGRTVLWRDRAPTSKYLFERYFERPVARGVSQDYVARVHLGFLLGYLQPARRHDVASEVRLAAERLSRGAPHCVDVALASSDGEHMHERCENNRCRCTS